MVFVRAAFIQLTEHEKQESTALSLNIHTDYNL